jgi:thiamine-phosphate pyrophosphorylase
MPSPLPFPPVQLVTGPWRDTEDLVTRVGAARAGRRGGVQLSAKASRARALHEAAAALRPLTRDAGAMLIVNGHLDIAIAVDADGVHLPEAGLAPAVARRLLGADSWIARSVHSVATIRAMSPGEIDAVQFGPVYDTPSKRGYGAPQGLEMLVAAAEAAHGPTGTRLIAVGGVNAERLAECHAAGADAVSVIGAIWEAPDVRAAARACADYR